MISVPPSNDLFWGKLSYMGHSLLSMLLCFVSMQEAEKERKVEYSLIPTTGTRNMHEVVLEIKPTSCLYLCAGSN